jgi:hypothetical protein
MAEPLITDIDTLLHVYTSAYASGIKSMLINWNKMSEEDAERQTQGIVTDLQAVPAIGEMWRNDIAAMLAGRPPSMDGLTVRLRGI